MTFEERRDLEAALAEFSDDERQARDRRRLRVAPSRCGRGLTATGINGGCSRLSRRNRDHVRNNMIAELWVVYLRAADNYDGPLLTRLSRANQPVIRTRNAFSTLLPSLFADI